MAWGCVGSGIGKDTFARHPLRLAGGKGKGT
jgi:hypothetical protein